MAECARHSGRLCRSGLEKQRVVALHGRCGVPRAVPQVVEVGERMLGERDPLLLDVGGSWAAAWRASNPVFPLLR